MRELWQDRPDGASFHGEFFDFDHAMCYPKPMAGPRTPIHIGGTAGPPHAAPGGSATGFSRSAPAAPS